VLSTRFSKSHHLVTCFHSWYLEKCRTASLRSTKLAVWRFRVCRGLLATFHSFHYRTNTLCLESLGESPHVLLDWALVAEELNVGTVDEELALGTLLKVLLTAERCEAPVLADDDLLATWELVLGTAESLDGSGTVLFLSACCT
jgi:hypothetical protein